MWLQRLNGEQYGSEPPEYREQSEVKAVPPQGRTAAAAEAASSTNPEIRKYIWHDFMLDKMSDVT